MGEIIAFANQKGGVGKTTTAANLAASLADLGKKVLLVDFDSQGNLSTSVGADQKKPGIYESLVGNTPVNQVIQKTSVENMDIIPANINLTGATIELAEMDGKEFYLKKVLAPIKDQYDYIFIDSPPSLGILTLNGLSAADFVVVPLQCEYFALQGLTLLLKTIQRVQKGANPNLRIKGIVFTMYDSRTKLAHEVVKEVGSYFKDKVYRTIIPRNIRLSEAPSHGTTINRYDASCVGAKSFNALAKEFLGNG